MSRATRGNESIELAAHKLCDNRGCPIVRGLGLMREVIISVIRLDANLRYLAVQRSKIDGRKRYYSLRSPVFNNLSHYDCSPGLGHRSKIAL